MKRFLANVLVVVLMLTVIAFSASADSNHEDTNFYNFRIEARDFTLLTEHRYKLNDSSVYVKLEPILDISVGVRVATFGFEYGSSTPVNETVSFGRNVNYVTCMKGYEYGIHNYINEHGYPLATLGFLSTADRDVIDGQWSPDSIGDLTIAH